jgi:hypothetical protein
LLTLGRGGGLPLANFDTGHAPEHGRPQGPALSSNLPRRLVSVRFAITSQLGAGAASPRVGWACYQGWAEELLVCC